MLLARDPTLVGSQFHRDTIDPGPQGRPSDSQFFRPIHDWAVAKGFVSGFPIFMPNSYGDCLLISAGGGEVVQIPLDELLPGASSTDSAWHARSP